MMTSLALLGGRPVRQQPFPAYQTLGPEEEAAVQRVVRGGVLSQFLGANHPDFYGGPEVLALEEAWKAAFDVPHAVTVNSATSGLIAAVGALGVTPGDEVIVSPYTMCASASAPLWWQAIPVFADVEAEHFCLNPDSVARKITPRTRGIIMVDLFGQPFDAPRLRALADAHGLWIIEDCAQAPGARLGEAWAGTLGDVGVFSLNYHKHIHTGEGGVAVTRDDRTAERLRLIRNHAEAVAGPRGMHGSDLYQMVGFNFRMTELEAAIGQEQLQKLPWLVQERLERVAWLEARLSQLPMFRIPAVRDGAQHVYYMHPLLFRPDNCPGVSRDRFMAAVMAELHPACWADRPRHTLSSADQARLGRFSCGYVRPIYREPLYQHRTAFGQSGLPWSLRPEETARWETLYQEGLCPVTEHLHEGTLVIHDLIRPEMDEADLEDVALAFEKVAERWQDLLD